MLNKKLKRRHSYSSLSLYKQCPYKYFLKYIKGYYPQGDSPFFGMGNLSHLCMENIGNGADIQEQIDYYKKEFKKLILKFPDFDFTQYDEKNRLFQKRMRQGVCSDEYEVVGTEVEFNISLFGEQIMGKIDLVLRHKKTKSLKVVDYKTNNKFFKTKELNQSLQQALYGLACEKIYGVVPVEYEYDMLYLGKCQSSLNDVPDIVAYAKKEIYDIFVEMNESFKDDEYKPKKTPLCSFCPYGNNKSYYPDVFYGGICDYAILWRRGEGVIDKGKIFVSKKKTPENENWGDWTY